MINFTKKQKLQIELSAVLELLQDPNIDQKYKIRLQTQKTKLNSQIQKL